MSGEGGGTPGTSLADGHADAALVVLRLAALLQPGLQQAEIAAGALEAARIFLGNPPGWLLLPREGELQLAAASNLPRQAEQRLGHMPLDAPSIETLVLREGRRRSYAAADLPADLDWTREVVQGAGLPGVLALPFAGGAVLCLGRGNDLDPKEEQLVEALGSIFGRALAPEPIRPAAADLDTELDRIADEIARGRKVEAELRASEERFRLAMEEAPIGMAVISLTGRFLRVNKVLCELLGYAESELVSLRWQDVTHPDDLESDLELGRELIDGVIPRYALQKRYLRKDGSEVLVLVRVALARDARGAPWYQISNIEDITERRRLEEAIASSERQFRRLFDTALDPIVIFDGERRFVDMNAAGLALLGLRREQVVGHRLEAFRGRLRGFDLQRAERDLLAAGELKDELEVRSRDGTIHVLNLAARANFMPGRHLAVFRDVTGRVQTEAKLRIRERQLAEAQALAHIGHWQLEPDGQHLSASAEAARIYGWPRAQERVGRGQLVDAIAPADRERFVAALDAAAERQESFVLEHGIVRPDGSVRIVRTRATAGSGAGKSCLLGVVEDITEERADADERERLLAALAAERLWLDSLFEHSPVAIFRIEAGGSMSANERAFELFGIARDDVDRLARIEGHRCESGELIPWEKMPLQRAIGGEVVQAEEICFVRQDGSTIATLVSAAPIRDGNGSYLGAVKLVEEITRLKDLERLRVEWTSVIAHDLRQPVTTISAQAQLLQRLARDSPQTLAKAEHILVSARQLNRMIGDLLDVSRIEASKLQLELQPLELEPFVRSVCERLAPEVAGHEVIVRASEALPTVCVDPIRLEQVLTNLVSNAVKYGNPGTPIEIDLERAGEQVAVRVANEGPGIAPEDIPVIFDRYFRTASAREKKVPGLGLGLYITRGLVEAHGGKIAMESEPGRKTAVRFTLPTRC